MGRWSFLEDIEDMEFDQEVLDDLEELPFSQFTPAT